MPIAPIRQSPCLKLMRINWLNSYRKPKKHNPNLAKAQFANTDRQTKQTARLSIIRISQLSLPANLKRMQPKSLYAKVLALSACPVSGNGLKSVKAEMTVIAVLVKRVISVRTRNLVQITNLSPTLKLNRKVKLSINHTPIAKADAQIEVANTDDAWLNQLLGKESEFRMNVAVGRFDFEAMLSRFRR